MIIFILFHYYVIVKAKSGYINSDYSDVSYKVYMWGFSCLDDSFDVLISRIGNVGLYNWFSCSYFTYYLISCSYVLTFTIHLSCTQYLICTPLGFIICTRGLHLITLNSHVQILEPVSWWIGCSWLKCAADPPVVVRGQQKLGHRRSFSFQFLSCLALEALLLLVSTSQLLLCISLHILYFYIFWWCNIPVILYHSLW